MNFWRRIQDNREQFFIVSGCLTLITMTLLIGSCSTIYDINKFRHEEYMEILNNDKIRAKDENWYQARQREGRLVASADEGSGSSSEGNDLWSLEVLQKQLAASEAISDEVLQRVFEALIELEARREIRS